MARDTDADRQYAKNNAPTPDAVTDTSQDFDHTPADDGPVVEKAPEGVTIGGPPAGEDPDDAPTSVTKAKEDERGTREGLPEKRDASAKKAPASKKAAKRA